MHYHTKSDNPSTYSREVMTTNINTYGMLAIWLVKPLLEVGLTAAVEEFKCIKEVLLKKQELCKSI